MRLACKRIGFVLATAVCMLVLFPAEAAAKPRTVTGKVLTSDGETVTGAVVQIKNTRTLQIRSFITQKDGRFHFAGLNPDIDYEIFARFRGRSSSTKTVSQFDSSEIVEIELVIPSEASP